MHACRDPTARVCEDAAECCAVLARTAMPWPNMAAEKGVSARYSWKKAMPETMENSVQLSCMLGTMTVAGKSCSACRGCTHAGRALPDQASLTSRCMAPAHGGPVALLHGMRALLPAAAGER